MSAPPTTRASRSRYASPAVGAGTRSSNPKDAGNSRDREKGTTGKDKDRGKDNATRPARSTSMERSRRFMENWIEPERVRLTSFQEDGLIRQGVLETMEPLGTRPKPAMIKKLVGIGREASPTASARGKLTGKKIVLKRKSAHTTPGAAGSAAPEPLSGTQSPTPAPSTTVATPQTATSPITTPTMPDLPLSSPTTKVALSNNTTSKAPIVPVSSTTTAIPSLPPAALSTTPLTEPVKQSIEDLSSLQNHLPTTPRSIASTYDSDECCRRESSSPSLPQLDVHSKLENVAPEEQTPQQTTAQRRTGPVYIASELARIVEHKDVVKTAVAKGVEEALRHFQYVDAWALQFMYDDKEEDTRFLLLTEAVFTQTATPQALGEWARELHAFKLLGMKGNAAVRHFVPEARTDKTFKPTKALPAEYGNLITMDLTKVRDPNNYKLQSSSTEAEGGVSQTEAEAEAEHERVATPPRKRQKTSRRESPVARKAPNSAARVSAMKGVDINRGSSNNKVVESLMRPRQRSMSEDSDLSSLSSLASLSPSPESASWALEKKTSETVAEAADDDNDLQMIHKPLSKAIAEDVAAASVTNGTSKAAADEAATPAQPIAGGRRRAPARARRGGPNNLAPEPGPVPRPSPGPGGPNFTSKSKAKPNSNLDSRNPSPDLSTTQPHSDNITNINNFITTTTQPPSKRSKRGMPNFDPQFSLEQGDEGTVRRRMARNTTLRLTQEARVKGDSFVRNTTINAPSPPERPASSQSSLSSLSALDDEPVFDDHPTPEIVAPVTRVAPASARATRSAKRTHDDAEDEATPFSLDFPVEAGLNTATTSSRAGTPRPNKKQRTGGRRLKLSPIKNKTAPLAGVPRGASRSSPVANGLLVNQEENDDFCSSCGGNGSLVCCDGCTRAFHELCHDPIVDPNDDSEWFCHDCTIKRDPSRIGEYSGPFGDLMTNLDKKGATSYRLPKRIREYFEGVRTGADGEYEDYVPPVKGKKKKEEPKPQEEDLYAIVDKDNRPIFCHSCSRSAAFNRPMMPCSICGLYWHMDCLDPPRPHLPNPRTFVCPCHIDDLLLNVPAQMGPAHKFRKIKGSSEIAYAYRRGNVNNGWIEVDDDESESDTRLNFRDPASYGRIYKVRSSGIKEDFISKFGVGRRRTIRKSRPSDRPQPPAPALCYREDAEEIYEAARDLMAFRREARGSVSAISDARIVAAKSEELIAMQAEMARLNAKIEAQLQKATILEEETRNQSTAAVGTPSVVKSEQSPDPPHIPLDSALTPVSDLMKDGDAPLSSKSGGAKPNSSGIETPETNDPDQRGSPGNMALD